MLNQQVVDFIGDRLGFTPFGGPPGGITASAVVNVCDDLLAECLDRGSHDNMSVIVIVTNSPQPPSTLIEESVAEGGEINVSRNNSRNRINNSNSSNKTGEQNQQQRTISPVPRKSFSSSLQQQAIINDELDLSGYLQSSSTSSSRGKKHREQTTNYSGSDNSSVSSGDTEIITHQRETSGLNNSSDLEEYSSSSTAVLPTSSQLVTPDSQNAKKKTRSKSILAQLFDPVETLDGGENENGVTNMQSFRGIQATNATGSPVNSNIPLNYDDNDGISSPLNTAIGTSKIRKQLF
jgi:hypothetical protein